MRFAITQSVEGPNRTKREGWVNLFSLLELGHPSSLALRHQHSWFLGFQTQTETYIIGFPGS